MDDLTTQIVAVHGNGLIDPVTDEVRHTFQIVNYAILCGIIGAFGIGSNIINICVFVKQGFKDSINISLLGLAVSDLSCAVATCWVSISFSPWFHNLNLPIEPLEVQYVSAALPHICFNRVTSFITAFITLERCLCIAMPLKVKIIITTFRTKVINIFMFLFTILIFCPFYFVHKLEWKYNVARNKSILGIAFTKDREIVDSITFFTHSVLLSSGLLLTVIVCTIVLVVKLNKKTKWRSESSGKITSQSESVSVKDKKVVKMVTLIAIIFIVCYIPPTCIFLIMTYNTDFSVTGSLRNVLYVVWSVVFVLEVFNSSVNIFVYLKMSSKYRVTLQAIVCGQSPEN